MKLTIYTILSLMLLSITVIATGCDLTEPDGRENYCFAVRVVGASKQYKLKNSKDKTAHTIMKSKESDLVELPWVGGTLEFKALETMGTAPTYLCSCLIYYYENGILEKEPVFLTFSNKQFPPDIAINEESDITEVDFKWGTVRCDMETLATTWLILNENTTPEPRYIYMGFGGVPVSHSFLVIQEAAR